MVARDVSEDLREREEAMATWRWWEEHYEELLARYPEQFVAIDKNRDVVGAAATLDELANLVATRGLDFHRDIDTKLLTGNKRWLL